MIMITEIIASSSCCPFFVLSLSLLCSLSLDPMIKKEPNYLGIRGFFEWFRILQRKDFFIQLVCERHRNSLHIGHSGIPSLLRDVPVFMGGVLFTVYIHKWCTSSDKHNKSGALFLCKTVHHFFLY